MGTTEEVFDVAIIGGGVVGCAIAREMAVFGMNAVLLESRSDLGDGTSKANTAILHTGFDTVPGSLESSLVTRGYELLGTYAKAANIAVEQTGALLIAWDDDQESSLEQLLEKAHDNGVISAGLVDSEEVRRREPHLGPGSRSGLVVPGESIIDPWSVSLAFAREAVANGLTLKRNARVRGVDHGVDVHELHLDGERIRATWVINAAGLQSDSVNRWFGHAEFFITPRRGQLIVFDKFARELLNEILLPVPTERTKGVLVSPTAWGNVLLGPTAEDLSDRSDTATTTEGIAQLLDAGRAILPTLLDEEITAMYAGLRAATEHRDYQIAVYPDERYLCVGGIRSTGLTGSLGIAEYVRSLLSQAGLALVAREAAMVPIMPPLGEHQIRPMMDNALIQRDPLYGTALCHCEQVSRGEVRDACHGAVAATDVEGVRRRTRAMNGRCQGFFCGAEVMAVISEETGIHVEVLTEVRTAR